MRKEVRKEDTGGKEEKKMHEEEKMMGEREQLRRRRRDCLVGSWSSEAEAGTLFVRWMF